MKKIIVGLTMLVIGISSNFALMAIRAFRDFLYAAYGYYARYIEFPEYSWVVLGLSIFSAIGLVIALIGAFTRENSNK